MNCFSSLPGSPVRKHGEASYRFDIVTFPKLMIMASNQESGGLRTRKRGGPVVWSHQNRSLPPHFLLRGSMKSYFFFLVVFFLVVFFLVVFFFAVVFLVAFFFFAVAMASSVRWSIYDERYLAP